MSLIMKKIVHVSNFNLLRLKGCFQNGFPIKISNGLTRNGYYVLNYPDRDLCRMFGFGHMNFLGKKRLNKHLIEFCKVTRPDALFVGHADNITEETLLEIKKLIPGLKILLWSCDWIVPGFAERNIKEILSKSQAADVIMISTGNSEQLKQFKRSHNQVAYLPNMVDKSIETAQTFLQKETAFDMMFCANTGQRQFCGIDTPVEEIVDEACRQIPDFKWLLAGLKGTKPLNGCDYLDAFAKAAMGFSLSRLNDVYLYSSDRLVHIMANGQLAFIDRRSGFNDLFAEDEAAFYQTPDEFYDKLKFYHTHPEARMDVAQKGYDKIHLEFEATNVTQYMADLLFGNPIKEKKKWHIII